MICLLCGYTGPVKDVVDHAHTTHKKPPPTDKQMLISKHTSYSLHNSPYMHMPLLPKPYR